MTRLKTLTRVVLLVLFVMAPVLAHAEQRLVTSQEPYWPSERAARLAEIDARVNELLRSAATADYLGQNEEKARLMRQLDELRAEAARLREPPVRASVVIGQGRSGSR